MTNLQRRALARVPLNEKQVQVVYDASRARPTQGPEDTTLQLVCESHERLRAEVQGAEVLLEDLRREIAAVLLLMDGLADVWGDEGVFRRCRDRLRALLPTTSATTGGAS